jgi:hypothetical protein
MQYDNKKPSSAFFLWLRTPIGYFLFVRENEAAGAADAAAWVMPAVRIFGSDN